MKKPSGWIALVDLCDALDAWADRVDSDAMEAAFASYLENTNAGDLVPRDKGGADRLNEALARVRLSARTAKDRFDAEHKAEVDKWRAGAFGPPTLENNPKTVDREIRNLVERVLFAAGGTVSLMESRPGLSPPALLERTGPVVATIDADGKPTGGVTFPVAHASTIEPGEVIPAAVLDALEVARATLAEELDAE